jgi:uncharacterized protein (DUF342 family)
MMLLTSVRNLRHSGVAITLLLLSTVTVYGQSLGDVARENREKKANATRKVVTDSDLDSPGREEPAESNNAKAASPGKTGTSHVPARSPLDSQAAEQWKKQILAQKRTVATLEKRLARFQGSLSSVDASAIARGEVFSRSQALEQERIAQVQEQLEEQRAKLLEMQEEARRAGMHTQVYDP